MGKPVRAESRYRQLRLTVTHEVSGRLTYSIYAKALNAKWDEHQVLVRDSIVGTRHRLESTEDVIQALLLILEEQLLPRQSHAD